LKIFLTSVGRWQLIFFRLTAIKERFSYCDSIGKVGQLRKTSRSSQNRLAR